MNTNDGKLNLKRKREKNNNKRWTDSEVKQLLEFLQEKEEYEKPTAQIFYKKFLEVSGIDATWDIVRWKVRNLKINYKKAETWRKSTGAGILESDAGVSSIQDKLRKMCRFYNELHDIFGQKSSEFTFEIYDSATASNMGLNSTHISDSNMDDQTEFCGFDEIEGFCLTPVIQYAGSDAVPVEDDECIELQTPSLPPLLAPISSTGPTCTTASPSSTVPTSTTVQNLSTSVQQTLQKNKAVHEFAAKLKRSAPKNSLDQLSLIQIERNSLLKMKVEFEKDKFNKEFDLKERQFAEDVQKRKQEMEFKKLELEKLERIERFEIEMRCKYGGQNNK